MKDRFKISQTFRIVTIVFMIIGVLVFILGLRSNPETTWGSYLISSYYFLSLAIGAAFFLAIQSITQSGWSSAFKRIPEAMISYIPFAAIFFIILYFGMNDLYKWSDSSIVADDKLLQYKSPYLNTAFFFIRMAVYFLLWIVFTFILRRFSLQEDQFNPADQEGILTLFRKSEFYSKILIFILAITFSLSTFDWIMSVQSHWFSTIFSFKNFMAAFLHGVTIIALIVFILHRKGYFPFLNEYHLHDFARYIFILSIIWGYLWFAQFIIIWYGNIPEETAYYYYRWQGGWEIMFYLQIILNWAVPFLVLLPVRPSRNMKIITSVIILLIIGQYIDLYVEVIPGITGTLNLGWIDAGLFLGFGGLFALVTGNTLGKAGIMPQNHPYIEESINHQFE